MPRTILFILTFGLSLPAHAYPVPLGSAPELREAAQGFAQQHPSQLNAKTLTRILVATEKPSTSSSSQSWLKSLNEALEKDARFETETAQALRLEVAQSYEASAMLNLEQVQLRARMGHDAVASLLAEGQKLQAVELARETLRRFPDIAIDRKRHPPTVVDFFQKQLKQFNNRDLVTLTVQGTLPGTLYADGKRLGPLKGETVYRLMPGKYKLWVHQAGDPMLVRPISLSSTPSALTFDPPLDRALRVLPHPHLACTQICEVLLGKFAQRLGTSTLDGIRPAPEGNGLYEVISVDTAGKVLRKTLINRHGLTVKLAAPTPASPGFQNSDTPETSNTFSALWLVPGGVGQFSQGRIGWGIAWATLETGLLAWNIHSRVRYDKNDPETDWAKTQTNISGYSLWAIGAIGVLEAVITGLLEEPKPE